MSRKFRYNEEYEYEDDDYSEYVKEHKSSKEDRQYKLRKPVDREDFYRRSRYNQDDDR